MQNNTPTRQRNAPATRWSNRILILALVGIFFLTFYPFRFAFRSAYPGNPSPFLLGGGGKDASIYSSLLNILLFIPFGFGLSEKLHERGVSRIRALCLCLFGGALLSYTIEFVQIYIPTRDSGWEDVFTNGTGSVFGFFLFELCGLAVIRFLSHAEAALERSLNLWKTALLISIYFVSWLAISASLQTETRLSNWDPGSLLVVGNDAAGKASSGWKGKVFRLEFWDHTVQEENARKLTSGKSPDAAEAGALASYDFSVSPFQDSLRFLPPLNWTVHTAQQDHNRGILLNGNSWLMSDAPVVDLVTDLERKNQFAIRVECTPEEVAGSDGRIVSISRLSGPVDLQIRQDNSALVLWFRNALSVRRSLLAWYVPNIFVAQERRDILFSYDGSNVSLFIDGNKWPRRYSLGPGTALARIFRRVKPSELDGYNDVYYFLVFFPAGAILGIGCLRKSLHTMAGFFFFVFSLLILSLLLEFTLCLSSGRPISGKAIGLSVILAVAGGLWINADRRSPVAQP